MFGPSSLHVAMQYIFHKMPQFAHKIFFGVCRLRARVVHRPIHYRRRFSVWASIVI